MAETCAVAFGRYLRMLRERRGLSLDDVATMSRSLADPVDKSYLSRCENGHYGIGFSKAITLSRIYGVPTEVLAERMELDTELDRIGGPETKGLSYAEMQKKGVAAAGRGAAWEAYAHFRDSVHLAQSADLSPTFRDLTEKNRQLQQAYDELKAAQDQLIEKERRERELQVAAEIQLSILPDELPKVDGINFGARILPARQVGGDFYDVFEISDNRIGVLIGDVADKGVPSALFMARAHALIMAEADIGLGPGEVMQLVNRHITRLQKSTQFVTVLYGILDLATREFKYARAGHEPPLLMSGDGKVERLPHGPGMAIGLWDTITLDERAIILPPGGTLLMFTDGMTDCRDPDGEPFGMERIKQTLSGYPNLTAQQVCDEMLETLKNYQSGSKQDDDVTLVAIHLE